jgi:hypothetical protein
MALPTNASLAVEESLARCWATLGVPLGLPRLEERKDGLIDPEALTVLSLLFCRDSRLLSDVAVWLAVNNDILIHQKIGHLARQLDGSRREELAKRAGSRELSAILPAVARSLGAAGRFSSASSGKVARREGKLAPRQEVATRAQMVKNRLVFGASSRADLVSALQCRHREATGRRLAALVGASPSTVSRVLADLHASGFLRPDGTLEVRLGSFPGFFVSARSIESMPRLVDASRVTHVGLRRAAIPEIQPDADGLGGEVARLLRSAK